MKTDFNESCVCGGSVERPNADCERCQFHAEVIRLRGMHTAWLLERSRDRPEVMRRALEHISKSSLVDFADSLAWGQWCRQMSGAGLDGDVETVMETATQRHGAAGSSSSGQDIGSRIG